MKNINFQKNSSVFRFLKEKKIIKKKINWDRIIYFIILGLIIFFVGKYFLYKGIYADAEGYVLMEKVEIRNINDCRIIKFFVNEGDTVSKKDSIFSYVEDVDNGGNFDVNSNSYNTKSKDWIEKEIYNTIKAIDLKRLEITENGQRIEELKITLEKAKNEVILDILPKAKLESYQSDISRLSFENERLQKELSHLYDYLSKLKKQIVPLGKNSFTGVGFGNEGGLKVFYSPIDSGTITTIYKQPYEVALKSEDILAIHKHYKIFIKAFFDQSDLKYIKPGDEVKVEFPDGGISIGRIDRFYFATYKLPEEFQKKFESTTRSLAVDILPASDEELKKWKFFYKMSVKVYRNKLDSFF